MVKADLRCPGIRHDDPVQPLGAETRQSRVKVGNDCKAAATPARLLRIDYAQYFDCSLASAQHRNFGEVTGTVKSDTLPAPSLALAKQSCTVGAGTTKKVEGHGQILGC